MIARYPERSALERGIGYSQLQATSDTQVRQEKDTVIREARKEAAAMNTRRQALDAAWDDD